MIRFLSLVLLSVPSLALSQNYQPAAAPLMTKWGKELSTSANPKPWQEYPRPQLVRDRWQNLNGLWDYAITTKDAPKPTKWDGKILVPFCPESALSGVGKVLQPNQTLWYRTTLSVPSEWKSEQILLQFGAVDWETRVFVNGTELVAREAEGAASPHKGGNTPISYDITAALKDATAELIVQVSDPTDTASQPRGKQKLKPEGIWYTPVSGIWQTVWLEPVRASHIVRVVATPDIEKGEVEFVVVGNTAAPAEVRVGQTNSETFAELGRGTLGKPFRVKVPNAKLWTPETPNLYDVEIGIVNTTGVGAWHTDIVKSYYAMRKISMLPDARGMMRMCLNNKPYFQMGPLDQGWWPDGLLTPPSDAAMKYDLEVLKSVGMNMLRKHIKVEPARYYYHCDKIGLLVWQDMPSGAVSNTKQFVAPNAPADGPFKAPEKAQFRHELRTLIDHLRGFPCIVVWVPFNEGWGQHDTNDVLKWVKNYDPTRLVDGPSGWADRGYGDMIDMHSYPGPNMFPASKTRATVLGEFGGLGLPLTGHLWQDKGNWGYQTLKTTDELRGGYRVLMAKMQPLVARGLSAAVYTQTTDVEGEVNGLLTYDRAVLKFDAAELRTMHANLNRAPGEIVELLPTSEKTAQLWRTDEVKPNDSWFKTDFDDTSWKTAKGGFGTNGTPGAVIGTEWKSPEIYLRRDWSLDKIPAGELVLRIHHDEDVEVYLNGVRVANLSGFVGEYFDLPLGPEAKKALVVGKNLIAVRCRQTRGGQYIDVGFGQLLRK